VKIRLLFLLAYFPTITVIFAIIQRIKPTSLIFDQSIALTFFYLVIFLAIIRMKIKKDKELLLFLVTASVSLVMLLNLVILNVDRSRSFYVLNWVNQNQIVLEQGVLNLDNVISKEKSSKEAINVRLEEQINRGLILKKEGELSLSRSGEIVLRIAEVVATVFNLQQWKDNKI
jgi:hypothetical protein